MKTEHKNILRNLRKQSGSIVTDASEKAFRRNARKEAKPLFSAMSKLFRQVRREVDAEIASTLTWDETFSARYRATF